MYFHSRKLRFIPAVAALLLAASPVLVLAQAAAPSNTPVIIAKFTKLVSTKTLKAGDVIDAKTLRPVKLTDGTEIPKGSTLIAKVSVVKSKSENNGNSILLFRIDNADVYKRQGTKWATNRRTGIKALPFVTLVCLILLALLAVAQVTHVHTCLLYTSRCV